jgi:hypothetical protein
MDPDISMFQLLCILVETLRGSLKQNTKSRAVHTAFRIDGRTWYIGVKNCDVDMVLRQVLAD